MTWRTWRIVAWVMLAGAWLVMLWHDFKAYRRGFRRVVPRRGVNGVVTRGRIYAPRQATTPTNGRAEPVVTIEAVVTRANGDVEVHRTGGR